MDPIAEDLRMYGELSDLAALPWSWVHDQLRDAGTYWVSAATSGHPHPRPVWGVLVDDGLRLSIGSPVLQRQVEADPTVTVHLDSSTDVVIVEGHAQAGTPADSERWIDAYDAKYEYEDDYSIERHGPLTIVVPTAVMAWRSAGWAGREGFQQVGRWRFA